MKLKGSYKFRASSQRVFNAILNPEILQSCIPGCKSVKYVDQNGIQASMSVPFPGLKGPYSATIRITERQEPTFLKFEVKREGAAGTINAFARITITDQADGSLLTYDSEATLGGAIAIANNPMGQGITKAQLNTFMKNLDKALA
jgi:carbon monoxide dehydrogenase subunit G